jgi:hypothetical protein
MGHPAKLYFRSEMWCTQIESMFRLGAPAAAAFCYTSCIMKIHRLLGLALLFFLPLSAIAKDKSYIQGKLVSAGTTQTILEGDQFDFATVVIQVDDILITARGRRVTRHSGEIVPGVIIGDPIPVNIDGNEIRLKLPSGKEFKASIVKRERIPK